MLRLTSEITIEGDSTWRFNAVAACKIVEDISTLTDTCELHLPKKIKWEEAIDNQGKPPVKRGDKITVKLGYDGELITRFTGFVKSIDTEVPIVIKCEDGMFLLKQLKVKPKAYKTGVLSEIISDLLKETKINFKLIDEDLKVGKYRTTRSTVAEELQELKERYMLSFYFRTINEENVLYVGLVYPFDNRKKLIFKHSKNIINESFEYRQKEEIKAKVEAISFDQKNNKISLELGDPDGDVIKMRIDGLTKEELRKYAEQSLERYKHNGLKGSFETFGAPEVSKCDVVDITARNASQGVYLVKKNEIDFGMSGYRQKIEIGQPLSVQ